MGLRGEQRPSGLACVLFDSPRDGAERVTALDAQRLASDLQAAVEYVFHGGAGAAAADSGPPPLVCDGCIDYDAVAQHVQRAVHAAAGLSPPAAQEEQAASESQQAGGQQEQEQASSSVDATHGSDSSAGSDQAPDEPSGLAASGSSGSEPGSPVAGARAAAAAPAAGQLEPLAGGAARGSGRLGPAEVGLVQARGTCDIAGNHITSRSNFATVRSNACVFRGRWQYEVQLGSAGIMQLGWTTLAARFTAEEGVGDNHDSYAYDGRRRMRWHSSNHPYGEHWAAGDVVGCCLDLDAGTMRFYRNGKDLGEAYANVRRGMPGMAYFAGVSLSYAERCEVNFGGRPFLFPVEGYEPLQHQVPDRYQQLAAAALGWPGQQQQQQQQQEQEQEQGQGQGEGAPDPARLSRQQQVAVARYLAGCLSRLMDVGAPAPAAIEAGDTDGAPGGTPVEGPRVAADMLAREQASLFPSAASPLPPATSRLPDADLIAALAAAAGEPGGSKPAVPTLPAVSGHGAGLAIRIDDCVLLGAALARHLGPLCFDPYCVEAVLLPLLDDAAGELAGGGTNGSGNGSCSGEDAAEAAEEAEGAAAEPGAGPREAGAAGGGGGQELGRQRLAQLLGLLSAVLEPEELAALATHCCQVLGCRVRGCRWALAELPRSDALGALRLWGAILECQAVREAWLASSEWPAQLEQLMCVRQPSEEDLTQLLSSLKVAWSEGGAGVMRSRPEDEAAFTADLHKIASGLDELEAAQADLLLQLWLEPSRGTAHSGSAHECDRSRTDGDEDGSAADGDSRGGHTAVQQVLQATDEASPSAASDASEGAEAAGAAEEAGRLAAQSALAAAESEAGGSGAAALALEAEELAEATPAAGPAQPPAPPLPPPLPRRHQQAAQQVAEEPQEGAYLRQWLQHLVDTNHGAMRHIPPPGLSDQTALVSTVFALLRLMNEQVTASPTSSAGFRLSELPLLRWEPSSTFLTGGALGGGGDPYRDAGRLGGTLSHLAREHPPTEEDRQPVHPLDLAAVVNYDATLRLAARAKEGPSFADVWLRDRLLMLCHMSAAPLMRGGLSHLAAMQAAMAGLRAVSAEGGGRMMEETRRQCQQEFVRSRRAHEWAQCWLLSPWRQQAAFVLAVDTARLLQRVSEHSQGLLRYVPELYVSACLDMVHAVHRFEPAVLDHAAMLGLGLHHIIKFVVCHLEDERIVSPEVQSRLLNMVLDGVQELDLLRELAGDPLSRSHLVPAMMRLFGRPQLWGPVSNFFALLVEGNGFLHPPPAFPAEFGEPLGEMRLLFKDACLADTDLCERFTHHLFDNANRMLTELVASLESMETSWTRGAGPSPQLLRLLSSTADYALVLLRVVEMMAAEMPQLFLGGSDMNLTRLAEVVGFAVPQFVSGRAHRALQRVAAHRLAAHLRLREAHLLQPLAGALAALWQAEQQARVQPGAQLREPAGQAAAETPADAEQPLPQARAAQRRRLSLAGALDRQAALTDDVLRALLDVELSQVEPLSAEVAAAAAEAAAAEGGESPDVQRSRQEGDLRRLRGLVDGLLARRAEAAAAAAAASEGRDGGGGGGRHAAGQAADLADAPEEFLDPILQTLMQDPVLLPDSHITLDRATIERHLLSSATDPFSRAPLSKDQLIPNTELRQQIEAWLQQLEEGDSGSRGTAEPGSGPNPSGTGSAGTSREDNSE